MTLKSLARPDRRMISPPAVPVAHPIVRPVIYTAGKSETQAYKENVLVHPAFRVTIHADGGDKRQRAVI
jgi:hypothetical protein